MRVLQISHRHHIAGGSDAVFFATRRLLREAGHEVIPFCMADPQNRPSHWERFFPAGADTASARLHDTIRYFYNSQARRNLNALLDHLGHVDVAHLHIYHGKQTPAILSVLRNRAIPVVHTLHEYKLACPVYTLERDGRPCLNCVRGSVLNVLRHRCKDGSLLRSGVMLAEMASARLLGDVRLVDRFICVSDFQRQIMRRAGLPAERLVTLHNFVEPGIAEPGHDGYLLYFGRIERLKGIETLVRAATRAGTRLLIAGAGSWSDRLRSLTDATDHIDYLGFRQGDALARLVARARAVVVPSQWYENCPMSVLEAKAAGRPVIGADIGGIPELVRDGIDGFLFEAGNVASLEAAFRRLAAADHETLSRNALADVKARFSPARHLQDLMRIYEDTCPRTTGAHLQPA